MAPPVEWLQAEAAPVGKSAATLGAEALSDLRLAEARSFPDTPIAPVLGHPRGRALVVATGDLVALLAAFAIAAGLRTLVFHGSEGPASVAQSLTDEGPYVAAYGFTMAIYGLYGRRMRRMDKAWFLDLGRLVHALAVGAILSVAVSAALWRVAGCPKLGWVQVTLMSAVGMVTLPATRAVAFKWVRDRWSIRCRVIVVGSGPLLLRVLSRLHRLPDVELVGTVANEPDDGRFHGLWLGTPRDLPSICEKLGVHRVLVGFGTEWSEEAIEIVRTLPPTVQVSLVSGFSELLTWQSQVEDLHGLTLLEVPAAQTGQAHRWAKRAVDVTLSLAALTVLSPLFLAVIVAIKLDSKGPILFRQRRVGKGGELFRILKFRTMTDGADGLRIDLSEHNEADGPMFKMRRDPRVTSVGSVLRRTSLDELPQLLNVLAGQMSLVGPRPLVPEESGRIDGWAARRFQVKPGMTGLWQVSGRSDLSFEELRRLDYAYAASWSFWWDIRILCQTPGSVLRRQGAY